MKTITILSDSPFICTGYSNQAKQIAKHFSDKGWNVHFLANSYTGQTVDYAKLTDGTEFKYKIYGMKGHQYFADQISEHLKKTNSDYFLILLDTFMLHGDPRNPQNGWFLGIDTSPAKTIFWFPSDGGAGMPIGCDLILKKVDYPVAMAKFGQKQVKDYYGINCLHIPHGTEPDRFYRMSDEERTRLRASWGLNDKFVVGCVARNQPRKMLDRELKAFKFVAEQIPNAVLLLHMDQFDPAAPFQLNSLIRRYNLENRVIFTKMCAFRAFDWNDMNNVYNLMDLFFMSTSGEGFGIPIIESMACEVPVVCTGYTTTEELVVQNNAGLSANLVGCEDVSFFNNNSIDYDNQVTNGTLTGSWEVERGLLDIKDAANKIIFLYKNPQMLKQMGVNGRKAVLEKYDFKQVAKQFEEIIK